MRRFDRTLGVLFRRLVVGVAVCAAPLASQDPLARAFLPPELVLRFADELELSDDARHRCRELADGASEKQAEGERRVRELKERLRELLMADELQVQEVESVARQVLEAETELKLGQIRVHTEVLSLLSPLQRKLARALHQQMRSARTEIPAKIERVRELAERMHRRGGAIDKVRQRMQEVRRAVEDGDVGRATELLDAILERLESRGPR